MFIDSTVWWDVPPSVGGPALRRRAIWNRDGIIVALQTQVDMALLTEGGRRPDPCYKHGPPDGGRMLGLTLAINIRLLDGGPLARGRTGLIDLIADYAPTLRSAREGIGHCSSGTRTGE